MTLVTTEYASDCNSYVSLVEAQTYIDAREGFDGTAWQALTDAQKEFRLTLAVQLLEANYQWRGGAATKPQARVFPFITPQDTELYRDDGEPFDDLDDLTDYCALVGVDLPTVPDDIKSAQVEVAYLVVDQCLGVTDQTDESEPLIKSIEVWGGVKVTVADGGASAKTVSLMKASFNSLTVVNLLVRKYINNLRGVLL